MTQKKNDPKKTEAITTFANDGLDTSTARMLLESMKKTQASQAQQSTSNKEKK
ncbi:hypothetical protein [Pantoea vagans]|uniref:hypothetical protein n=1 Tax=Pantoea TaxID=53335 RepID=UPI0018666662|nr:hypothetical protein [Pantoea vagans]